MGWEPWEPYQNRNKNDKLTGLDIELITIISNADNCKVSFIKKPWKRHLHELKSGKIDLAAGVSKTSEREQYAFFSNPYRNETVALYLRKGESKNLQFKSLNDIIDHKFILGVTRDYYYGEEYKILVKNPKFKKKIREVSNDQVNYVKLIKKRIDGFLADPYVTNLGLTREGFLDRIERHPLPIFSTDVFIIFSKKSTLLNIVTDFNKALKKVKQNGTYSQIINKYLKQ